MANNLHDINRLIKDRKTVTVASTITLFLLAVHFFFVGFFKFDIVAEILAFDSFTLYRMWAITISLCLGVLSYALYIQNKKDVTEALQKVKARVTEEAKEFAEKVDDAMDSDEKVEDAEVKEVEKTEAKQVNVAKSTSKKKSN